MNVSSSSALRILRNTVPLTVNGPLNPAETRPNEAQRAARYTWCLSNAIALEGTGAKHGS